MAADSIAYQTQQLWYLHKSCICIHSTSTQFI